MRGNFWILYILCSTLNQTKKDRH